MPSMPIDVSKLLSAITNIGQQRDMPSRVELVFDPTASDALVDKVIDAFVESIITNTPPAISGESAMHAMKVVFANEQSAQLGKAVDVQL